MLGIRCTLQQLSVTRQYSDVVFRVPCAKNSDTVSEDSELPTLHTINEHTNETEDKESKDLKIEDQSSTRSNISGFYGRAPTQEPNSGFWNDSDGTGRKRT